jgi:hypothetical protein
MPADHGFRADVLRAHGARGDEIGELLAYTENAFAPADAGDADLPLPDEPFAAAWDGYAARAGEIGVFPALREVLPQLRFPVRAGVSSSDEYRAATLRGEAAEDAEGGVEMVDPEGLSLFLHPTPAGRIPVVVARAREDFVALVRAITRKNEPDAIPDSMGACIVGGYNNWDRVARLRRAWEAENPQSASVGGWGSHFRSEVVPRKELYQDRFILLSRGPYSAVPAADLGLDDEAWIEKSLAIRLEHECAHYFTRRVFGSMRNSLHDELIADYQGIRAAEGRYRADWFLRFMGLEAFPAYRPGGRLQNYRGQPPLSEAAFRVLQALLKSAAETLEIVDALRPAAPADPREAGRALRALTGLALEELASPDGAALFREAYRSTARDERIATISA